jgi:hypothetical protein
MSSYLQAEISCELLKAHTVCDVTGNRHSAQTGASNCSGTVVRVTTWSVAVNQPAHDSRDVNDEEAELHVGKMCLLGVGLFGIASRLSDDGVDKEDGEFEGNRSL